MDEIDVSDGTLVSRIISDLPDPILRLLVSTSDRGQEYLLLVSSANEVRVWDIESRFHLAAFVLGGLRAKQTALVAVAATTGHSRCILLYSKGGSSQVEAMHIQRQADRPGSATLLAVLEPKAADIKAAAVTAIAGGCASLLALPYFHGPPLLSRLASSAPNPPSGRGGHCRGYRHRVPVRLHGRAAGRRRWRHR